MGNAGRDDVNGIRFLSLISLFAVALGKVGSFIMLVFMVLQLSGSAGTYPIQLSNGFFEAIHPWLPMTYSIDALRNTISIGGPILGDVIFLVGLLVISNLLWLGFYFVKHLHYRFSDDGTWYDDSTGILNKIR
nr:YhgE/Pip family protein [Secundilactobacillus oryzae]